MIWMLILIFLRLQEEQEFKAYKQPPKRKNTKKGRMTVHGGSNMRLNRRTIVYNNEEDDKPCKFTSKNSFICIL